MTRGRKRHPFPTTTRALWSVLVLVACLAADPAPAPAQDTPAPAAESGTVAPVTSGPTGAPADAPAPEPASSPSPSINLAETEEGAVRARLFEMWERWRELNEGTKVEDAEALASQIRDALEEPGIQGRRVLAGATLKEGYRLLRDKRMVEAQRAFAFASALDPTLPQARFGAGYSGLRRGTGILQWLVEGIRGTLFYGHGTWGRLFVIANALAVLFTAGAAFIAVVTVGLFLRYQGRFRHAIQEMFLKRVTTQIAILISFAALFLPIVLPLGIYWLVAFWFAAFWGYMTRGERRLTLGCLVFMIASPFLFHAVQARYRSLSNPVLLAMAAVESGDVDPRVVHEIEQAAQKVPTDENVRFLLSSVYATAGLKTEATAHLQQIIEKDPTYVRAYVNLGNIHFRDQDWAIATGFYERAIERDSGYALAHYNLALSWLFRLESRKHEEEMQEARRLDPSLVEGLQSRSKENCADDTLTYAETLDLMKAIEASATPADPGGASPSVGAAAASPVFLVAGAALAFILYRVWSRRLMFRARACVKCGRPYCGHCQPGGETSAYCSQCLHLFIKKDGVSPDVRTRKVAEVNRHQKLLDILSRLLNVIVPGLGDLYRDRFSRGIVYAALWCTLLAFLFVPGRIILYPYDVFGTTPGALFALNLLAVALVWAGSNLLPLFRKAA